MNTLWRNITIGIVGLLLVIAIIIKTPWMQAKLDNLTSVNLESIIPLPVKDAEPTPVRMIFTGDIMMNRGVESSVAKNYNGDFSKLFEKIAWFRDADIVFGNLEGPVSDVGNNVGSKYSFRMDPAILPVLKNAGFTIVSFANNHVGDWNIAAFTDTLNRLQNTEIAVTGAGLDKAQAEQVTIINKNGMNIGFIGFSDVGPNWMQAKNATSTTDAQPGILLASDPRRTEIIQQAKSQVDFLVVSYHWGDEYVPFSARQKTLAESSIDAGADLIIGHHPHVIQDYTEYKGKFIFYSLGNFIFDQSFSPETMRGMIVDLTINPNGTYNALDVKTSEQDKTYRIIEVREFDKSTDAVLKKTEQVVTCPKPKDPNQVNKSLYPVSHDLGLGNYIPSNLEPIPKTVTVRGASKQCLTSATITALEKMVIDAKKSGLSLVVSSAYRSSNLQQTLFTNNQAQNPNQLFPSVAKPEHSEHQLGTAVDFRSGTDASFTLESFGRSPEYAWMAENAHLYGFVRSYPSDKESITGYIAEPWHWRYVGVDHAVNVKEQEVTLYEYLQSIFEQ